MPANRRQGRRFRWWLDVTGSAEINLQGRAIRAIAGMARSYKIPLAHTVSPRFCTCRPPVRASYTPGTF